MDHVFVQVYVFTYMCLLISCLCVCVCVIVKSLYLSKQEDGASPPLHSRHLADLVGCWATCKLRKYSMYFVKPGVHRIPRCPPRVELKVHQWRFSYYVRWPSLFELFCLNSVKNNKSGNVNFPPSRPITVGLLLIKIVIMTLIHCYHYK